MASSSSSPQQNAAAANSAAAAAAKKNDDGGANNDDENNNNNNNDRSSPPPSSSSSSLWSDKLRDKLWSLTEESSKESHQAVANWIAFHRKRADEFCERFRTELSSASVDDDGDTKKSALPAGQPPPRRRRQKVALSVVHVLVLGSDVVGGDATAAADGDRRERLADLRTAIGERVLLPVTAKTSDGGEDGNSALGPEFASLLLKEYWPEWDDAHSFESPTLLGQIKRQLQSIAGTGTAKSSSSSAAVAAAAVAPKQTDSDGDVAMMGAGGGGGDDAETGEKKKKAQTSAEMPKADAGKKDEPEDDKKPPAKTLPPSTATASKAAATKSTSTTPPSYDFEKTGIPAKKVDPKSLLLPCQTIATVQISRDLSNDSAVQLSSLFSSLPEDVRRTCAEASERDEEEEDGGNAAAAFELPEDKARDFSIRIPESLIDMDFDEQLKNIATFRKLVIQQKNARQQLLKLMIQSRCKFGADEAAEAFHNADRAVEQLAARKQILADAMELEGLDIFDDSGNDNSKKNDDDDKKTKVRKFPPLTWYKPETAGDDGAATAEPEPKRQRT